MDKMKPKLEGADRTVSPAAKDLDGLRSELLPKRKMQATRKIKLPVAVVADLAETAEQQEFV